MGNYNDSKISYAESELGSVVAINLINRENTVITFFDSLKSFLHRDITFAMIRG